MNIDGRALLASGKGSQYSALEVVIRILHTADERCIEISTVLCILGVVIVIAVVVVVVERTILVIRVIFVLVHVISVLDKGLEARHVYTVVRRRIDAGVLCDLDGSFDLDANAILVFGFGKAVVDPGDDAVSCCVAHDNALVPLKALSGPQSALPAGEICDLLIRNAERVDGFKQSGVVGEAAESHAMGRMAIVQTWITRFDAVQTAVERRRLDAYLRDQVACQMVLEVARLVRRIVLVEEGVQDARGTACTTHDCNTTKSAIGKRHESLSQYF